MNERIKKLIEQSQKVVGYTDGGYTELKALDPEKFAESLVKECMTTILKESKWYWDKEEFESANAIQNAARRLKEHFGVE